MSLAETNGAGKNRKMTGHIANAARPGLRRSAVVAAVVAVGCLLQSCANDRLTTGAIPEDYRLRHPIVLADAEHTLDIPVAVGERSLTIGTRDVIRGFANDYSGRASGTVHILIPQGTPNAASAAAVRKQVRRELVGAGVPSTRIVDTSYVPSNPGAAAPIRLSFVATTAMTAPCGQWPEDMNAGLYQNRNWENFGCASQSNLAAQIANPTDLMGPRAMTPIDAEQRSNVIETYRGASATGF